MELTLFWQVFHFIYTYAIIVDICPFTLDELVQAFHDKVISHLWPMLIHWKYFQLLLFNSNFGIQSIYLFTARVSQDSMLLGKIHVALLTLLLSDIEVELTNGFSPHLNKSCNFLALLHSVSCLFSLPQFWRSWI